MPAHDTTVIRLAPQRPEAPLRPRSASLTPRGRLLLALLASLVLAGAFLLGRVSSSAAEVLPGSRVHVVVPGETLWTIAKELAPQQDPRAVIVRIQSVNKMSGSAIQAGQRLRLPD